MNGEQIQLIAESAERLDKYLSGLFPDISRSKLVRLIEQEKVLVDGQVERASFKLKVGAVIDIEMVELSFAHNLEPADIPLDIRYEDDDLIVINKPRGLATHPAESLKEPSLVNALLGYGAQLSSTGESFRPGIVHRLDKETTGLLVVAKNDLAHQGLAAQIEAKTAERVYLAIVSGSIPYERATIDKPILRSVGNRILMTVDAKGKPARTHIKRVGHVNVGDMIVCRLETGRTHQIRVHLQSIGHPVMGDKLYAPAEFHKVPMQLHATVLAFNHPRDGRRVEIVCEPPEDFMGASLFDAAQL